MSRLDHPRRRLAIMRVALRRLIDQDRPFTVAEIGCGIDGNSMAKAPPDVVKMVGRLRALGHLTSTRGAYRVRPGEESSIAKLLRANKDSDALLLDYATPKPPVPPPFRILRTPYPCTADQLRAHWRRLAFERHPDRGGDVAEFVRLKTAYEEATRIVAGVAWTSASEWGAVGT